MSTRQEVIALRRLGSLNYRKAERAKERHDPVARFYRAKAIEFYSAAGALIWAHTNAAAGL
jgi:hypothetical protein